MAMDEKILSNEYLDTALNNAKNWCDSYVKNHIPKIPKMDFDIFSYEIDNSLLGPDAILDIENPGMIRISTEKLKWYLERETCSEMQDFPRYCITKNGMEMITGPTEVDPESIFVNLIVQYVLLRNPENMSMVFGKTMKEIAQKIENANRLERGLRPWPIY